jgi:hypothetical protein
MKVFGFGKTKKKIHIGQFCRLVQLNVYEKQPIDMDFLDDNLVLSDKERRFLNADLFAFRFVAFNLLLLRNALLNKTKRTVDDLGYICTYSLKLALQDKGHNLDDIDEIEAIFTNQLDKHFKQFPNVDITDIDSETLKSTASISFTKYFGEMFLFATPDKPNGELAIENEKEAVVLMTALEVFKVVQEIFDEEYKSYKIVDL